MRRFSSYGPLDVSRHYYAPREELIEKVYISLVGDEPGSTGHYITVWAPRQCGKTWIMLQVLAKLDQLDDVDAVKVDLEHLRTETDIDRTVTAIGEEILRAISIEVEPPHNIRQFQELFSSDVLKKPLVLILDEFDALPEETINALTGVFRNIYNRMMQESGKPVAQRRYMLTGVALIGVRSVLGIENIKGSPFNVQQSMHVPKLTRSEVERLFDWYERETAHKVEPEVVERLFYETAGQPGLTCWFGELLTQGFEGYDVETDRTVTIRDFEIAYAAATFALPNNNIINIISKVRQGPEKNFVLDMFQTSEKLEFRFDNPVINSLYMNGVVDKDVKDNIHYFVKFSCPFVQKRLFNYFSDRLFHYMGPLTDPYIPLDNIISDTHIDIPNLMDLYQRYLHKNKDWLFKDAPRRSDLRLYEAVFHFNLFAYLSEFLKSPGGTVIPEFPTGNGKIDLAVKYAGQTYGIELKSYSHQRNYEQALIQAATYGIRLGLSKIYLVFFVEYIDAPNRQKLQIPYTHTGTTITVIPIFIETGK